MIVPTPEQFAAMTSEQRHTFNRQFEREHAMTYATASNGDTTATNPATKLPHTPAYLARTGASLHGPFKATDVKTPEGWQIVTTGYGASRVVEHASSRDKARARARELTATGEITRAVTA